MPKPSRKISALDNAGFQDDHDPSDIRQQSQNEAPQGVVRDERGQEQPVDKKRAQQVDEGERAFPDRDPAKKKTGEF